jgi:hypothetical protein
VDSEPPQALVFLKSQHFAFVRDEGRVRHVEKSILDLAGSKPKSLSLGLRTELDIHKLSSWSTILHQKLAV